MAYASNLPSMFVYVHLHVQISNRLIVHAYVFSPLACILRPSHLSNVPVSLKLCLITTRTWQLPKFLAHLILVHVVIFLSWQHHFNFDFPDDSFGNNFFANNKNYCYNLFNEGQLGEF